jgi:hypothetical protein
LARPSARYLKHLETLRSKRSVPPRTAADIMFDVVKSAHQVSKGPLTAPVSHSSAPEEAEPRQRSRSGLVYFLLAAEVWRVKIGWAGDPTSRLINLQVASPVEVALLGMMEAPDPYALEHSLHRRFDHLRVRGEWFKLSADLVAFIRENRTSDPFHHQSGDDLLAAWGG